LGGFDIVRSISDHDGMPRRASRPLHRGLNDVGVRLGIRGVVGRGRRCNQIAEAGALQQRLQFILFGGTGDREREPVVTKTLEQFARARERMQPRQPGLRKNLCATRRDAAPFPRFSLDAGYERHEFVATHADRPAHVFEGNRDPVFGKRLHPRPRVRSVAVDECAVHVEDHGCVTSGGRQKLASSSSSSSTSSKS